MPFSPAALLAELQRHWPAAPDSGAQPPVTRSGDAQRFGARPNIVQSGITQVCIALSGGLDSTVLLRALADMVCERPGVFTVRAVHIDHQLQPQSAHWRQWCERLASAAGIEFSYRTVQVTASHSMGIEAAARMARYDALRSQLAPGEALLTAHHADDQLETVLLALSRGAGVSGLAAMPACQPFGPGWLMRPLLAFSRIELEQWARQQGLSWIDDPSNDDRQFSRNYLRHQVIPLLRQRWPSIEHSVARSAGHLAEAGSLLEGLARQDLAAAAVGECLRVAALASLDVARRRNLLRYWLRVRGARAPSTRKLLALEHDMLLAQEDRLPCVQWDDFEVRRHRGLLYAARQLPAMVGLPAPLSWHWRSALALPAGLGRLEMTPAQGGLAQARLPECLQVAFRSGGEVLHRKLKKLLYEAAVLPWWRDRVPLIHAAGQLVAVGDLWIAAELAAGPGEQGLRILWRDRPAAMVPMDPSSA